jgi:DNA end-binding protein Ku
MRAIWKGSISFGLVNIPVGVYPALQPSEQIHCKLLRKRDLSPIKNKRVAVADGEEVPWEEVVKGYEYEKERYVVLNQEDFDRVQVRSTQTVDIREFVDADKIDSLYFDEPYYLAPEKGGAKAYVILREALKRTGKVGIAKVVLKTREYLAAVRPHEDALVLELMHYTDELADASELEIPAALPAAGEKELRMAQDLIQTMYHDWAPAKYRDEYREGLKEIIRQKIASGGKEIAAPKAKGKRVSNEVVDLVEVLQRSLEQFQGRKRAGGNK